MSLENIVAAFERCSPPVTTKAPATPYTSSNKWVKGERLLQACNEFKEHPWDLLKVDPQAPGKFGGTSWGDFKLVYGKRLNCESDIECVMPINDWITSTGFKSVPALDFAWAHMDLQQVDLLLAANKAAFIRGDQYRYRKTNKYAQLMCNSYWFAEAYCELMCAKRFKLEWDYSTGLSKYKIRVVPVKEPRALKEQLLTAPEDRHPDPDQYHITIFVGFDVGPQPQGSMIGSKSVVPDDIWAFAPSYSYLIGWTLDAMLCHYPLRNIPPIGWSGFKPTTGRTLCAGDLLSPELLSHYIDKWQPGNFNIKDNEDLCYLPWPNKHCIIPHNRFSNSGVISIPRGWSMEDTHKERTYENEVVGDVLKEWFKSLDAHLKLMRKAVQHYSPDRQVKSTIGAKERSKRLRDKKFRYKVK